MHLSLVVTKAFAVCAMTASLCAVASCAEARRNPQNSSRTAAASLHLAVFVVPVFEARPNMAPKGEESSITFTFASSPLTQTYQERALPREDNSHIGKQQPAILRTLTIVPK